MSTNWDGAYWDENGVLHIDVYANPPDTEPEITTNEFDENDEDFEDETDEKSDKNEPEHTYATIDCGGECGGCVALIVDDEVVSGPPFHPNCKCSLNLSDIENSQYQDSNLHQDVASDRSVDTRDIKWLKRALVKLGYYNPDSRAGESDKKLNQYPNQRLFDAIENFRKENKIKETGAVKPGHWTEVKINEALKKEQMNNMKMSNDYKNFEQAYSELKEREGGYTTGKNQKKDEPTNMGIKQSTLDKYSAKYPDKNFPQDIKDLKEHQAKEIYKSEYWDNTRIPQIENDRIRNAIFDMNVMGGAGTVVQRAINSFSDTNLKVDGVIGKETIKAINAIPDTRIEEFMSMIKSERINYLQNTRNWETAKNGWIKRTNTY